MNLETFFNNFDLLADAPNSVQKLRELILQLAVMGKLVPQDENDEPASVLLEKIKATRKQLIKQGKVSKSKLLAPIQLNEIPIYKLPTGWHWCKLGQVIDCYRGHNPPKDNFVEQPQEGYVRFIQITDFKTDEKAVYVPVSKKLKYVYKGEIAMAAYRHIGKISRNVEGAFNVAICKVIEIPPMSLDFIEMVIGTDFVKGELLKASGRAHIPSMHTDHLLSLVIPLPPLNEQKRIVAKVDELMAMCDRLSERQQKRRETRIKINNAAIGQLLTAREPEVFNKSWQHIYNNFDLLYNTPDNIGKLRQAILQLAVQGKLVPQDENDEPASVLLEKIKFDKERLFKEGKIKKEKLLPAIQAEELEHDIPEKWNWSRLIDICELITDGTHQTPKYTKQGRMFLSAQNVKPFRFMPEVHRFVSEEDYQGYIKNRKPEFEDILLTRVGAGIGEAAVIDQKLDFAIYVSVALVRPFKKFINPYYLTIWLNSPSGTHKSSINTYGKGVSQGNLNLGLINKFIVSIPPLNEQKRIVAKVNQLMSLCDELETKLTQSVTNSEKLMEAAVRQILAANSTKTDKHESTLLETIPAETNKPETKTTRRRNKKTEGQDTEAVQLNLPLF